MQKLSGCAVFESFALRFLGPHCWLCLRYFRSLYGLYAGGIFVKLVGRNLCTLHGKDDLQVSRLGMICGMFMADTSL